MSRVAVSAEIWPILSEEARIRSESEPALAGVYHLNILDHASFEAALAYVLASKLETDAVSAMLIRQIIDDALHDDAAITAAVCEDLKAHRTRDPACDSYVSPFLYFKGFHALQVHRIAHWLWNRSQHWLAYLFQNRCASGFDVDIHPAARIGSGIMIDHGTGLVVGETASIGDFVSILHGVTLGGCGARGGDRHPKIGSGVLISAGAKVLGPVHIGDGAKIGAGSLVLTDVAAHSTVAGVPARVVGRPSCAQPALDMDQRLEDNAE